MQINDLHDYDSARDRALSAPAQYWRGCGVLGPAPMLALRVIEPIAEPLARLRLERRRAAPGGVRRAASALRRLHRARRDLRLLAAPRSGHCYFTLKDADGAPRAAALRDVPARRAACSTSRRRDGQRSSCAGGSRVYEPRGELQFVVESMQRAGAGALFEQFLRLKAQARGRGPVRRGAQAAAAALPRARSASSPRSAAAALHDVLTALARRAPHVARGRLSEPGAGRRRAAALLAAAIGRAGRRARGRRADRLPRRRLARGPLGVQRRARRARDRGVADAGGLRRRPRDRRHAGRLRRRPARADADRRGRAGRAAARRAAGARWRSLARACGARRARAARCAGAAARPCGAAAGAAGDALRASGRGCRLLGQRLRRGVDARDCVATPAQHRCRRLRACALRRALARRAARSTRAATRLASLDPRRVLARGYALLTDARRRATRIVVGARGAGRRAAARRRRRQR